MAHERCAIVGNHIESLCLSDTASSAEPFCVFWLELAEKFCVCNVVRNSVERRCCQIYRRRSAVTKCITKLNKMMTSCATYEKIEENMVSRKIRRYIMMTGSTFLSPFGSSKFWTPAVLFLFPLPFLSVVFVSFSTLWLFSAKRGKIPRGCLSQFHCLFARHYFFFFGTVLQQK